MLLTLLTVFLGGRALAQTPAEFLRLSRELPVPRAPAAVPVGDPGTIVARDVRSVISWDEWGNRLARAEVVLVGEKHDEARHHELQLDALKLIHQRRGAVVVGLEMLSRDQQPVLDAFMAGTMPLEDFRKFWQQAWGYDLNLYLPILEYARASGLKVRGLNAPRAVIRQIARGGMASLTPEQRAQLPVRVDPITEPRYLDYVRRSLGDHGPLDPVREGRMLEAMAAWNETMAQSVADLLAAGDAPVLVAAGMGHMLYGAGIGESLGRRGDPARAVVLPYPLDGERRPLPELLAALQHTASRDIELADYFRLLP